MPQAIPAIASWIGTTVAGWASAAGAGFVAAAGYGAVAYYASYIALNVALAYGISEATKPKSERPQGGEVDLQLDADYPRQMVIGERGIAGSVVAHYSTGGGDNNNLHLVYALADHPCDSLVAVYADGRLVQGALSHGVRTVVTAYSYSGGPRVWMTFWDGRPGQTADTNLITVSALDGDVIAGKKEGWTSNHVGAGVCYVHLELQWDSDILTSIPKFIFQLKGAPLYDRRLDTTAGGSGSHRIDDPTTWEWTDNAAVALDHYLLGYMVEEETIAFGIGLLPEEVPYDVFAAAADLADEDVDTGVGGAVETIKRYRANGVIGAESYYEEIIETLQLQMAARVVDLGGRIGFLGAEERTPVVHLTDADLCSDETLQFSDKLPFDELIGAVEGRYCDPANLWQPTDYVRQVANGMVFPDGGEAQTKTIEFPFEIHPRRSVRLASAYLEREIKQPRLIAAFMPSAWKLEAGDWFTFTSDILQFADEPFEVIDILKHGDFTVNITARAVNPNFTAYANDNDPDLSVPPDFDPVELLLDEPTGTLIAVSLSGGGATEPALRFTLATFDSLSRELVIEIRQWDGSAFTGDPIPVRAHVDQLVTLVRSGILPDKQYKARIRTRAGLRESPWTAWSSAVSTSATYLVPAASVGTSIVGQGALATLNGVYFGSTTIQETSGGATATLGNFKTSSGTAAAIAGQGYFATENYINSASRIDLIGVGLVKDPCFTDDGYWINVEVSGGVGLISAATSAWFRTVTSNVPERQQILIDASGRSGPNYAHIHLALQNWDGSASTMSRYLSQVTGGRYYDLSASIWNASNQGTTIGVAWLKQDATTAGGDSTLSVSVGSGFTAKKGRVQAPTDAAYARVYTHNGGGSTMTGAMAVSSLQLTPTPVWADGTPMESLRPGEVGANVTETRTAASITGQGWGATASEANASNAQLPLGENLLINTDWQNGFAGWYEGWDGDSGYPIVRGMSDTDSVGGSPTAYSGVIRTHYHCIAHAAVPDGKVADGLVTKTYSNLADLKRYAVRVQGGERVHFSAYMSAHRGRAWLILQAFAADGTTVTDSFNAYGTINHNGFNAGNPANAERVGDFATLSSNARYLCLITRLIAQGGQDNPYLFSGWPMIAKVSATQTVAPPYKTGQIDRYADPTIENTAAAIAGQGGFATVNPYYQSSDPGSLADGAFWGDTTNGLMKFRFGGAWIVVGDIGGVLKATIGSAINVIGSSGFTGNIAVTVTGGDGTYSYRWTKMPYEAGIAASLSNATTSTVTVAASLSTGQDSTGRVQCVITDGKGRSITISQSYNFSKTS